jgi:peptidoglycan hydrolase CwlO-like protein
VQVEEGKLTRLQEAANTKASRLESARARLQGLQDKLATAAAEQKELTAAAAAKGKEAHAASAEQRRVG